MTAYTILRPHMINRIQYQAGAVVVLSEAAASLLARPGVVSKDGIVPEMQRPVPAILQPPRRVARKCCGW